MSKILNTTFFLFVSCCLLLTRMCIFVIILCFYYPIINNPITFQTPTIRNHVNPTCEFPKIPLKCFIFIPKSNLCCFAASFCSKCKLLKKDKNPFLIPFILLIQEQKRVFFLGRK